MSGFVANLFSKNKKKKKSPQVGRVSVASALKSAGVKSLDPDVDVRILLAQRLHALFPAQGVENLARLYAFVVQSLGTYALDEILKIRLALSSALKDFAYLAPKEVADIVRDAERDVSEPILRFCAGLQDSDLLAILSLHPEGWVVRTVQEIARSRVSPSVVDQSDNHKLEDIVALAKETREWHEHSGKHLEMPVHVAVEMGAFIDTAVRETLTAQGKLDPDNIDEITRVFRRRMSLIEFKNKGQSPVSERIDVTLNEGGLGNDAIMDGLAVRDFEFVKAVLAVLAGASVKVIEDVISARAPSPLVALCWKAGLSMRIALLIQQELAEISPKRLIYPKAGTDYPFTEKEMREQLDFLGVKR